MRQFALDLATILLPLLVPLAVAFVVRTLGLEKDGKAAAAVLQAAEHAQSLVYKRMAERGVPLSDKPAVDKLIFSAADRTSLRVWNSMQRMKVSPNEFRDMVEEKLGNSLAADPSVTIPRGG